MLTNMKFEKGTILSSLTEYRKIICIDGDKFFYLECTDLGLKQWRLNPDKFYCQRPQISKLKVMGKDDVTQIEITAIMSAIDAKNKFYNRVFIINDTLLSGSKNALHEFARTM